MSQKSKLKFRLNFAFLAVASSLLSFVPVANAANEASENAAQTVRIISLDNRLRVEIGGELFTEYFFKDVPRPYLYPIIGPEKKRMTRDWPMENSPDEEHDHPHHRSLWFALGDINGIDFWSESAAAGRTVHENFLDVRSGKTGVIRSRNKWVAKDGTVVATDERAIRFSGNADQQVIDYEITLHASHGELKLGDTKEGSMAIRVAESMRLSHGKNKKGAGHIVNSEGVRDGATWGKRAAWCDYYGPVNGEIVGVAIFDHPKNPRFPTWWHVRDYGLFAANPFGIHDFEKKPAGTGDLIIPAGKSLTLRYRFVFHKGDEQQAGIAKLFKEYSAQ